MCVSVCISNGNKIEGKTFLKEGEKEENKKDEGAKMENMSVGIENGAIQRHTHIESHIFNMKLVLNTLLMLSFIKSMLSFCSKTFVSIE